MKKFTLFLLLFSFVTAGERFKETRYIYALDSKKVFQGQIEADKNSVEISYSKPKKQKLLYTPDSLTIREGEETRTVDASSNRQIGFIYTILQSTFTENTESLKQFFYIEKVGVRTVLTGRGVASEYIENVVIVRENKKLSYMIINMANGDRVTIEILN